MKALPDEAAQGWLRNICAECDDDRLRHPAARRWLGAPLCPPEEFVVAKTFRGLGLELVGLGSVDFPRGWKMCGRGALPRCEKPYASDGTIMQF